MPVTNCQDPCSGLHVRNDIVNELLDAIYEDVLFYPQYFTNKKEVAVGQEAYWAKDWGALNINSSYLFTRNWIQNMNILRLDEVSSKNEWEFCQWILVQFDFPALNFFKVYMVIMCTSPPIKFGVGGFKKICAFYLK